MCTVSFYKTLEQVIITSNRDESVHRPNATAPKSNSTFGKRLFFPKDPKAGGTWFVANEKGDAFVLLNGAEFNHIPKSYYGKSRGVVLLEIASADNFNIEWLQTDLNDVAPFTVIAYAKAELIQLRWDGEKKEQKALAGSSSMIWSSSTLYSSKIIEDRRTWFNEFICKKNQDVDADDLIDFHTNTSLNDKDNGLIINRNGKMLTKSVTQWILHNGSFSLRHIDLVEQTTTILTEKLC
ncbi:NRDE family protein [Pedobacter sp.]